MTNPATTLRALFEEWKDPEQQSPYHARGFNAGANGNAYVEHETAIRAIADISRALDVLEAEGHRVAHYKRSMKLFIDALLNVPHAWTQAGVQTQTLTPHMFDMLEALEGFLDSNTPMLTDHARANIDELLDEVMAALDEDDELPTLLREHLTRVVHTLRTCLEEFAATGRADLKTGLYDLWVSLYAASGATTGENQSKWKNFAEKMGYPTASSLLGSLPGVAVSVLQLTRGN
ncbi:hypothetical protein J2T10_003354 [Paenarthrobacter nicotinovorans]|uniref:Uncharacterized protein n=1 Tax=Paenarthrobacter nicotinovorans TaxID=29320 RepID=A0ABT9TPU9_PAENI|nr:hypothetical protein [Paenarthrobacter nicotinovorans]MDQ0103689.1 hypothetical protein [Paenarthrobacter nicotinovorans]